MTVNLLFGPPESSDFSWFFALDGPHVVCGGTTAEQVASFLKEKLVLKLKYVNSAVPPTYQIKGVDLVTEGIVTMSCVLEKFKSKAFVSDSQDGASLIYKFLMEATDVNFFVGKLENPANKSFKALKSKFELVSSIASYLHILGKITEVREV